jgi:hypothetical protein
MSIGDHAIDNHRTHVKTVDPSIEAQAVTGVAFDREPEVIAEGAHKWRFPGGPLPPASQVIEPIGWLARVVRDEPAVEQLAHLLKCTRGGLWVGSRLSYHQTMVTGCTPQSLLLPSIQLDSNGRAVR